MDIHITHARAAERRGQWEEAAKQWRKASGAVGSNKTFIARQIESCELLQSASEKGSKFESSVKEEILSTKFPSRIQANPADTKPRINLYI